VLGEGHEVRQHPTGIASSDGLLVVEVDHRRFFFVAGFSASSISITGIPSRTGYR
jgi:hypothetical protein